MLTLNNPGLISSLTGHPIGLKALKTNDGKLILIAKLNKEALLAMKLRSGFKISFVEYVSDGSRAHTLLTLIYDTPNEPLSLNNTFYDVPESRELLELFSQEVFKVYGFDEHNREFFGYNARFGDIEKFRGIKETLKLAKYRSNIEQGFQNKINYYYQFAVQKKQDLTFSIDFTSAVYSEATHFFDMTRFIATPSNELKPIHYTLERKEAGEQQEQDILLLLEQIFTDGDAYLNPIRFENSEEFVDILIITETHALLVQAKDSPNTDLSLSTPVSRKKKTTIKHLKKAAKQLKGAINHAKKNNILKFKLDEKTIEVDLKGRELIGLAVVKEIFEEDLGEYTKILMEPFHATGAPCLALDYMELYEYSQHLTPHTFFDLCFKLHSEGVKTGVIPRVKFQKPY
ncbi:hypothetical protein [Pseudomonas viridiflava]|uniref:hypothetical protein n=1 Tax=Pseudomonas viridiflava TaxID=33069 RepID=UPI0013CF2F7E|nr:hypothetical protein [Pseudomonas viridiflava]